MAKKKVEEQRRFRILTRQALSVALEQPVSFPVTVGQHSCRVFFKPSEVDPGLQRQLGGAFVHVEFEAAQSDMLRAVSLGAQLTEDILAGLAVITGLQFGGVTFVQLLDVTSRDITPFLFLLAPSHLHSERSVTTNDIAHLRSMVAHWDYLPRGGRLRRAAGLYRRSLQEPDDISAFQEAYMGLEALEPALAEQIGVTPGSEEVKGNCEKCGAEYTRVRTVLNGVRAYIRGAQHPEPAANEQRESEWKKMNKLRHGLFHSLEDLDKLRTVARSVVAAAAHHLHDAICCLSHAHDLESPDYRVIKGAKQLVLKGIVEPGIQGPLEDSLPVLTVKEFGWDAHPEYGLVPRVNVVPNYGSAEIGGNFFWVPDPLDLASEADLIPARFESQ